MRKRVNENDNINIDELYTESHVNSVVAMAVDYATSFSVYRHEKVTSIDVSFGCIGDESFESYTIRIAKSGTVCVYVTTNPALTFDSGVEYISYVDAFEKIVDIFLGHS